MSQHLTEQLAPTVDTRDEVAREAVREFRSLQPVLTSYARNITGRKDVRVEIATRDNGSTDGTRIFYRPPIELGKKLRHERSLCNTRGTDRFQRCPACKVREKIMVTILHEIGHIAGESFQTANDADMRLAIE